MKKIVSNYNEVIRDFKTDYITYKKTHRNFSFWLKHKKK